MPWPSPSYFSPAAAARPRRRHQASLREPRCRAFYDRKRSEGKRHHQAVLALARRRVDVLYAMLRNGTLYDPAYSA